MRDIEFWESISIFSETERWAEVLPIIVDVELIGDLVFGGLPLDFKSGRHSKLIERSGSQFDIELIEHGSSVVKLNGVFAKFNTHMFLVIRIQFDYLIINSECESMIFHMIHHAFRQSRHWDSYYERDRHIQGAVRNIKVPQVPQK